MSGNWQESESIPVVIATGTAITTSGTAKLGQYSHIGLVVPPLTGSTGSISFDVSPDNVGYYRLKGTNAAEIKLSVGEGSMTVAEMPWLSPVCYVKLIESATQEAARTINFICKS